MTPSPFHRNPLLLAAGWLATLILLAAAPASAQMRLTGTVLDAGGGAGLAGVNVAVEGSMTGAVTSDDGTFAIEVAGLPVTLVVSHVGYETSRVVVRESGDLKVVLRAAAVEVEDLVVVGSRFVPRTAISSPVPVDNIGAGELASTGQPSVDKALTYTVPAYNSTQQTISDATAHFDPADLRGLGPSRTLVLINGKRKNPSSLVYINDTPGKGEVGVDMKSIPAAAVKRVEVLRDGAAAQYGSDAIAGVINVILEDEPEGTEVRLVTGLMDEGDGGFRGYELSTGLQLGQDGFLRLSHGFHDQDETNRAPEPCASGADLDTCDGLFGGLLGLVDTDEERAWIRDNPDLGMRVGLPNTTSSDLFYNTGMTLSEQSEIYSYGGLQYRNGISYALYRNPYWIPDPHYIHHDPGEPYGGFHPTFETDIFDRTLSVGARGRRADWDFDLSNTSGSNSVDYTVRRSLNTDLGAESPTTFRTGGYGFSHNVSNLDMARRMGGATLAMGAEFRTENFRAEAGEEPSYVGSGTQSFPGLQPQNEADVNRHNVGIYADVNYDLTSRVLLGAAARLENYGDFGDNLSWKLNGRCGFLKERGSLRASVSTGFRAPSLHQLYLSNIQTLISGGTVSNQGTFNNESPVLRALKVPRLEEEKSFNLSAGLALRPLDAVFLSLDVYQVDVDDRIVYSSSIASADTSTTVGAILGQYDITSLKFFTNAVDTRTRGVDLVASWARALGRGLIDVDLAAHFFETEIRGGITTPAPIAEAGFEIFDRKEQSRILTARPKSKILLRAAYRRGALSATLNNSRFGAVTWQHAADPAMDQTFDPRIVTDLNVEYRLNETVRFGAGLNNLLNVYPEKIDNKGDVLTDLGGRFQYPWEVNQFGFNGRTGTVRLRIRF